MFIVLEGIDGSGTTTQMARLAEALRARGQRVHTTREPSDGPIGVFIRSVLRKEVDVPPDALALLFAADRVAHVAQEIEPALARGEVVICDRYLGSSIVYQSQFVPEAFVRAANSRARLPDLTLIVDVPAEVAAARRAARGGPAELFEVDALQVALAAAYRELPSRSSSPHVRVDGTGSPAQVEALLLAEVDALLRSI